jgi:UDP-3-O-[3-hydroxymyristoyl] glucosamine N-acyltransferase
VIGPGVSIGPHAVIGEDVVIGSRSTIGAHAVVGSGCRIGEDSMIHAHATLYEGVLLGKRVIVRSGARIGAEGFGYVWTDGGHRQVPQVGGCVLEDDVEIGANSTVDRGSVGDTVIGSGSKIDNLVHVGHNVILGRHTILVAQVGISGSTRVGDGAVLGGQVGVAGHLTIGAGARLGAQAGVISDVPAGHTYSGYPARPHREAMRAQAGIFKLSEMFRRLRALEERVFRSNDAS